MFKTVWIYVIAFLALGAGGWYLYVVRQPAPVVATPAQLPQAPSSSFQPKDDDTNKRRQEGIGSIRDLKPVPLPASSGHY